MSTPKERPAPIRRPLHEEPDWDQLREVDSEPPFVLDIEWQEEEEKPEHAHKDELRSEC